MNLEQLHLMWTLIPFELVNTLYMVSASTLVAILFGLPLGVILTITDQGHLKENRLIHQVLGSIVNTLRSFPFAILMIAIIPFTRWIVGTSLGTTASIVPLSIAAIPFLARLVEGSLKEVDKGMIEAAIVIGSTNWQTITKVLIPEAMPSLIGATTTTIINLVGYSAMAGTMGGGGLGKIAIQYGYQRFNVPLMVVTVIILIVVVQIIQLVGQQAAKHLNGKRGKGLNT